jgi:hypothetical protein
LSSNTYTGPKYTLVLWFAFDTRPALYPSCRRLALYRYLRADFIMRFATIAAVLFSALTVSAQTAGPDAQNVTELFEEFAKLPTCVVCIAAKFFARPRPPSLTGRQTTCVAKALPHSTCTDPTDFACLCTDEPYMAFSQMCIVSSCTIKQMLSASLLE